MKQDTYYQKVFARRNLVKEILMQLFMGLASWPRLLLEVFVRKNLGERYFSLSIGIFLSIVLAVVPYVIESTTGYGEIDLWDYTKNYFTWYLYIAAFLYFSLRRQKEIDHSPSFFELPRFTLSTGDVNQKFFQIKIKGEPIDRRFIETKLEPVLFLAIGIILILFHQKIGILISVCSILYSLSYIAANYLADEHIKNEMDKIVVSKAIGSYLSIDVDDNDDKTSPDPSGCNLTWRKPISKETRIKLTKILQDDEDFDDVE